MVQRNALDLCGAKQMMQSVLLLSFVIAVVGDDSGSQSEGSWWKSNPFAFKKAKSKAKIANEWSYSKFCYKSWTFYGCIMVVILMIASLASMAIPIEDEAMKASVHVVRCAILLTGTGLLLVAGCASYCRYGDLKRYSKRKEFYPDTLDEYEDQRVDLYNAVSTDMYRNEHNVDGFMMGFSIWMLFLAIAFLAYGYCHGEKFNGISANMFHATCISLVSLGGVGLAFWGWRTIIHQYYPDKDYDKNTANLFETDRVLRVAANRTRYGGCPNETKAYIEKCRRWYPGSYIRRRLQHLQKNQ